MPQEYSTLAPFYAGWDRYQTLLVDALANLTDEQLALRPAPQQWPVWQLAAHISSARVWWFQRMGEGDASLDPMKTWDDDGEPPRSAAELVAGLEATWRVIADCLARWTPADLGATFYHERRGVDLTRQWIVWHVLEHDLNHGGELFLTLGIHGLPTPDL
jgi:uncharacterized damage-inducible protein DinB